jgi:hypothetical protein
MESLVDQQGKLLPIAQIAEIFAHSMRGMDKSARDAMLTNEALVKVFDVRGIRVIHAFAEQGQKGFDAMARSMSMSRTVAEKFKIAMSQLTGVTESLKAVVERVAIAFADGGFTGAVRRAADAAIFIIDAYSRLISSVPGLTVVMAGLAGSLFAVGVAALGVGLLLQAINFGLAGYITYTATATGMTRSWSVAIMGLSAAFGKLRLAMFAIPGIGWIAGAVAAIGGLDALQKLSAWEEESNAMEANNRKPILRSERGIPLGRAGSIMGGGSGMGTGETLGTFFGGVASRLAIGPALSVAEETAANTARTADGVAELVAAGRVVPNAAGLRAGIAGGGPVAAAGVAATSDRDLISAAERTAMATEQSNSLLRRMAESYHAGVAFQ